MDKQEEKAMKERFKQDSIEHINKAIADYKVARKLGASNEEFARIFRKMALYADDLRGTYHEEASTAPANDSFEEDWEAKDMMMLAEKQAEHEAENKLKHVLKHITKTFKDTELEGFKAMFIKDMEGNKIVFENEEEEETYTYKIARVLSEEEALMMGIGFTKDFIDDYIRMNIG